MPIFQEARSVLCALVVAAIFVAGFSLSHALDKVKIQRMELDIKARNDNAAALLASKTAEVSAATADAIKSNNELDKAHEAYIRTANDYDQQLDAIRLYPDSRRSCSSPATTSHSAGVSEDAASEAELSAELDRLVKEKARIADEAADYADKAYQFAA
ncbi:MAG: hypothetical protein ACXV8Q_09325, partial [Methylobacter sp.]